MLAEHPTRRLPTAWIVVVAVVLLGLGIGLWLTQQRPPVSGTPSEIGAEAGATRINEGGQVTIKVTPQPRSGDRAFTVVLDTHVVDLDGYDLRELATLRIGNVELQPRSWDAPKGGHHRLGTLTFPATPADGSLELIIRGVADVPKRSFRWP